MSNPFGDEEIQYSNPFADASVQRAMNDNEEDFSTSAYVPTYEEPHSSSKSTSYASPPSYTQSLPSQPQQASQQQQKQLEDQAMYIAKKQAELAEKEEELERQRQQVQSQNRAIAGAPKPNWPICYPYIYHSIKDEIPIADQKMVRALYYNWNFSIICWIINLIGCLCILISGYSGKDFGYSILYIVVMPPLSFLLWYRPVYNAFMKDSSMYYYIFFFFNFWHLLFVAYIIIGIQDSGSAGFINTIFMFNFDSGNHKAEASILLVGLLMWTAHLSVSIFLFYKVRSHYRSRGHTFQEARNQAFSRAASSQAAQTVVTQAATTAVHNAFNPYARQVDEDL